MKKSFLWIVRVLILCVLFTTSCSPYELEDPTQAKVTIIQDRSDQESGETAPEDIVTTPKMPLDETPQK